MDRTRKIFLFIIFIVFAVTVPGFIGSSVQTISEQSAQATNQVFETLYQTCVASKNTGDLQIAYDKCGQLVSLAPNYADGQTLLIGIREQLLADYYDAGMAAFNQELWEEAIAWFDKVLELDLSYRNTANLRAEALAHSGLSTPIDTRPVPTPSKEIMPTRTPIAIIPMEGPVAYFPFNGNSLDESNNGNDGRVYGAILTNDRFGNNSSAYNFDGINDYIEIAHSDSLRFGTELTISAWVKISSVTGETQRIVTKWSNGSNNLDQQVFLLDYRTTNEHGIAFNFANSGEHFHHLTQFQPINIADEVWHFIATTYDGHYAKMFLDGKLISEELVMVVAPNATSRIYIGGGGSRHPMPIYMFKGAIDDLRIYNRDLSEDEIQALYRQGGWPIN